MPIVLRDFKILSIAYRVLHIFFSFYTTHSEHAALQLLALANVGQIENGWGIHKKEGLSWTDGLDGIYHCPVRRNSDCLMSGYILSTCYTVI